MRRRQGAHVRAVLSVCVWLIACRLSPLVHAATPEASAAVIVEVPQGAEPTSEEIAGRIVAELQAGGIAARIVATPAVGQEQPSTPTDEVAEATWVVFVRVAGDRASLRVVDRLTAKRVERDIVLPDAAAVASTLALASVELLEASLLELETEHVTLPPREVSPPSVALPITRSPRVTGFLRVGPGVVAPVHLRLPMVVAELAGGVLLGHRTDVGLAATFPLHRLPAHTAQAAVELLTFGVGPIVGVNVLPRASPVRLDLGGSVSALAVRVRATPAGRGTRVSTHWTALAGPRVGVAVERRRWLVRLDALVGVPLVGLRLLTEGHVAADLGTVWLGAFATFGPHLHRPSTPRATR